MNHGELTKLQIKTCYVLFYLWYSNVLAALRLCCMECWRINELRVGINIQVAVVYKFEFISRNYSRSSPLRKTTSVNIISVLIYIGTRWRTRVRHCATSWKVAVSFSEGVTGISQ
jgi:hypothetical protein